MITRSFPSPLTALLSLLIAAFAVNWASAWDHEPPLPPENALP